MSTRRGVCVLVMCWAQRDPASSRWFRMDRGRPRATPREREYCESKL